jgi:hypothetical protein
MKLFSFTCPAFGDDRLVEMRGFSHRSQPFKIQVTWYPFEEWYVKAHLYAKNRREAVRQLTRAGVNARDLTDGRTVKEHPLCVT